MYNKTRVSKLTDSHIFPNNFEKMKGKYAAQMLRATVAAAMSLSIRFRFLPASASGTTEFLERIDKLFVTSIIERLKGWTIKWTF
jgi:hypothetical protein